VGLEPDSITGRSERSHGRVRQRTVTLVPGTQDDRDAYDRLLRYVDTSDGIDVGLALIKANLAISRYDSRDGYGRHDRQEVYVAADGLESPPIIMGHSAGEVFTQILLDHGPTAA